MILQLHNRVFEVADARELFKLEIGFDGHGWMESVTVLKKDGTRWGIHSTGFEFGEMPVGVYETTGVKK